MEKSKKMLLVPATIFVIVMLLTVSFQSQPPKVTGTWNLKVETAAGSGTPVFLLKQENDTLITGTYRGQFGESPVKGTIKAGRLDLKFSASDMVMEYTGTITADSIKGKVIFGSMGEGTFTGKRKDN
jgi:hypothetical protein